MIEPVRFPKDALPPDGIRLLEEVERLRGRVEQLEGAVVLALAHWGDWEQVERRLRGAMEER